MAYIRKTEDVHIIMYRYTGHEAEEIDTVTQADGGYKEARRLLSEYQLAYRGTGASVWRTYKRRKIEYPVFIIAHDTLLGGVVAQELGKPLNNWEKQITLAQVQAVQYVGDISADRHGRAGYAGVGAEFLWADNHTKYRIVNLLKNPPN
ncbi:hypothetical protein UFOVP1492_134 [uncultured Caudovirales phage]|uniref:Uncharacterized protein n=1 Tax=uncultured Caudovirales phage TaxID=2100421 RepID=A0A6J5QMV8_9CAUD|nr:hypothetical protein UFOVP1127_136 [uncultured Caudovirales phage]CAB4193412.1 hypothetical protein UFOVP1242_74 [uncultured Caudovirales phage]CAB4217936.1 hypothetical protein UFOVP1492_134 [uncultured Caudovirales phage]CAB5231164.1 hypothetical protein UFOVP1580_27 [uncultured Caudovirales phage]